MSIIKAIHASRAPFFGLGCVGIYWGCFAAMVPDIKAQTGASDSQFGLALMGAAVGGMVAMFMAPKLSKSLGKFLLPVLALVLAILMQFPIFAQSLLSLFTFLIIMGAGVASFDICTNMRLSELEERHSLHLMNANHAMFSLCFGLSALIGGGLRQVGLEPSQIFPTMGGVLLVMSVFTWERNWQPVEADASAKPVPKRLPWFFILLVAVMLFVSFLGENSIESWSALFLERELGSAPGEGSFGPTTLGLVMCVIRLLGQVFTEKLGEERIVFWSGILGMLGATVIALAPTQTIALIGIGLCATGMAVIVPTANSLLGKLVHREQRAIAISRAWLFGFTGFFVGPALIGFVSDLWGLRVAFAVVAILIAVIIPAVIAVQMRRAYLANTA
ncbi:fucose permease [Pacificibacter maritimus]|uniref:Fucose permease n=1 Tax=Pacificibacter maritimus TaxID=762213 RepID=A0A3N4UA65_9RHOB|nr:MFS transporter [Pacificibacter maritimus]RPE67352.1 fucose permease [Pacificibacter maritimus]